ncbi:MAG: PilZ domain-containing protein [Treponema sp.]|nr:PilZ domain-containing protein [Treponema sp.]
MNAPIGFGMFPLQIEDFAWGGEELGTQAMFFLIGLLAVVAIFIIIGALMNRGKLSAFNEGYIPAKRRRRSFSSFALYRIANDMGLDREKAKMLEFVLRNDNVSDLIKSLDSPELMDRHFKRAYRLIEQTSISEDELNNRLSLLFATRNIIETYTYSDTASISSTRQIHENTAAIIIVGDSDLNYPTRIISSQSDVLIVEHPTNNKGSHVPINKGSKVTLAFFTKSSKGFSVTSRVIGSIETMNRHILKLAHSNKIKKLSSRRFRRRQMTISTSFYLVKVAAAPGNDKGNRLLVDKRKFSGNIIDISVGGCSIRTSAPIKPGQKLKVEFTQEDDFTVAALGEVLRTNRTGYNTIMHIKFLKIPRKSLNFINAMVYEYADI